MTQLSPDTTIYSKAIARLKNLGLRYQRGDISTPEDYYASIRDTITSIYEYNYRPSLAYNFIEDGEPPSSKESLFFWQSLETDVNIIQDQINYLKAHAISSFNASVDNMQKASNENARVRGKLNSLLLYSDGISEKERIFGDFFTNYDYIDINNSDIDIYNSGSIILGSQSTITNLLSSSNPSIHPSSNGISGNNFELEDPAGAGILSVDGSANLIFKNESDNYSNLASLIDNEPITRFEYEIYSLSDEYRGESSITKDKGFKIKKRDETEVDWASGPLQVNGERLNYLKLLLDFDLGSVQKASIATLTPHKVSEQSTHPIRVSKVMVSQDGSDWTTVSKNAVWIGNDINLTGTSASDEIVIGRAFWSFQEQLVRYLRFEIDQIKPLDDVAIGHIYFEKVEETNTDGGVISAGRVDGPVPSVLKIDDYVQPGIVSGLVKKRESLIGKRWAIGIKDVALAAAEFNETATMVSRSFKIDGIIDKVAIEADYDIPSGFNQAEGNWVEFYVSPNDGADWFQISNIQDDFYGIPEIVSFNNPIPKEFREPNVAYYNVKGTVNSVIVKIVLKRPADLINSTPVVKSYKLKVLKK